MVNTTEYILINGISGLDTNYEYSFNLKSESFVNKQLLKLIHQLNRLLY
jgi:hypothetical protein